MKCDNCGNDYDKAFKVKLDSGIEHVFDCFECAINRLAPFCAHCNTRIIGHGVETQSRIYCCAHCAQAKENTNLRDRSM